MHKGIDIQAKHDEILATEDKGKVIKVNNNTDGGAGRYVTVEYSRPGNTALSQEEKRRTIATIINSAVVSHQMSQNYENDMGAQADRQESVQIR